MRASLTRGGARNSKDRQSDCLTSGQCRGILKAMALASDRGLSFNRFHTIHWQKYIDYYHQNNLTPMTATQYQVAFFNSARDWSKKKLEALQSHERIAYLWVRENDRGDKSKGDHVHIFWHIPQPIVDQFIRYTMRWLEAATKAPYIAGASKYKVIGRTSRDYLNNEPLHDINYDNVKNYILKGASMDAAHAIGLSRHDEGGIVIGKRWGRSQNLG